MRRQIIITISVLTGLLITGGFITKEPAGKAELGEMLFFDSILSRDRTISCASCHRPGYAFADTSIVSTGVKGRKGTRNSPTAMNILQNKAFFWDGRAKTLEEQALEPIANPVEMDLPVDEAIRRLQKDKKYNAYFRKIFGRRPTREDLAAAIAAFERTLETSDSPFDNWKFTGDSTFVSEDVTRGFHLFNGKAKCVKCHFGSDLTTHEFRNIGLFNGKQLNDSGRIMISGNSDDLGKFKTPTLRNVELTAPYMHNGMIRTLEDVIEFYNDTKKIVPDPINKDTILAKPLELTRQEKKDLVAFLVSLTDKRFKK